MPREELNLSSLYNSLDITKVPRGKFFTGQNFSTDQGIVQARQGYNLIGSRPGYLITDVCWGIGYGQFACNETQSLTLTGGPTGGTIVIRSPIQGATNSATIPWNAQASDVQTAVQPWTSFADGELVFSGGPFPNEAIYATYKGRYADAPQGLLTLQTNSLSGGSTPSLSVAHFVNGGPHEEYLVVIQPNGAGSSTLYSVTSANGFLTTTWTVVATGLTSSNWSFDQQEDKIYAQNATDGLLYRQLGGAWSGTAGIPNVQSPVIAPTAITLNDVPGGAGATPFAFQWNTGGSATFGTFVGWGATPPTVSVGTGGGYISIIVKTAITTPTVVALTVTLHGAEDLSHADYWNFNLRSIIQAGDTVLVTQSDGTTLGMSLGTTGPVVVTPVFQDAGTNDGSSSTTGNYGRNFHFGSSQRTARSSSLSFVFTFNVLQSRINDIFQIQLFQYQTWPNDTMAMLDIANGATLSSIKYFNTFFQASTSTESKLSPYVRSQVVPWYPFFGAHMTVSAQGSSQLTTSDFVKFYRQDQFGLIRFIGMVANATSGTVSLVDNNMLDELDALPVFGVLHLPDGALPSCLGVWNQCLIVGGDRKIWISKQGQPIFYAPDPEDNVAVQAFEAVESTDTGAPRTDYMSQTRSETVVALVGQDTLYAFGPNTSYAMTSGGGDGISTGGNSLSPPRILPGSRGCLSTRGATAESGGVLASALSGLWYYAVSPSYSGTIQPGSIIQQEITEDVRTSWATLVGSDGSKIVVYYYLDEIWIFNTNRYLKFTRNKKIEQGTFKDSILDCVGNANGLLFITSDGRLMRMGDRLTNPQTTDNGTAILWTAQTGIMESGRQKLQNFECLYVGVPSIQVDTWDGARVHKAQKFDLSNARQFVNGFPLANLLQGYQFSLTLSGGVNDSISMIALNADPMPSKAS